VRQQVPKNGVKGLVAQVAYAVPILVEIVHESHVFSRTAHAVQIQELYTTILSNHWGVKVILLICQTNKRSTKGLE
jgi:hypothetical protein